MMRKTEKPVVFAAMSKRNFFLREHIIRFILMAGYTPTCAFMMYSYYLLGTVEKKDLISANNDLIKRSDELWVFGEISSGVAEEIKLAKNLEMKIRYFRSKEDICEFEEVAESNVIKEVK